MNHLLKTLIAGLLTVSSSTYGESIWYQVEMIVFAHNDETAETEEQWPDDVALSYPSRLKMLFDAVSLPSSVDNTLTTGIEINVPSLLSQSNDQANTLDNELLLENPTLLATPPVEPADNLPTALTGEGTVLRPLPFQRLDEDAKTLREAFQHLRRIDRYRPLFHEVWQQPMQSRGRSPAILITGGNAYGSHFELEGTIKLSVERYLHIDTDLWLHRFEPNFGQTSTFQVPELPTNTGTDIMLGDSYSPFSLIIDEPYNVARTVTLRQSRRMRSGEIHYLDHPLFGVIVLVTPLAQD
jgi:hypothetical protein